MKKKIISLLSLSMLAFPSLTITSCTVTESKNKNSWEIRDHFTSFYIGDITFETPPNDEGFFDANTTNEQLILKQIMLNNPNVDINELNVESIGYKQSLISVKQGSPKYKADEFLVSYNETMTIYRSSTNKIRATNERDLSHLISDEIIDMGVFDGEKTIINVKAKKMPSSLNSKISNIDKLFYNNPHEIIEGIQYWDVSKVESMSGTFQFAHSFNQDISMWDTSSVKNMSFLFDQAYNFNQNIGSWNTSNLENASYLFTNAWSFNQDLSSWDVSNVTNMYQLFAYARNFNQSLESWSTSKVTNMQGMFEGTDFFNQDLSSWDVSNVTDTSRMFKKSTYFNYDLSSWDVSNVSNMSEMFTENKKFNYDISNWDVEKVTSWDNFRTNAALRVENIPEKFRPKTAN